MSASDEFLAVILNVFETSVFVSFLPGFWGLDDFDRGRKIETVTSACRALVLLEFLDSR